MSKAITFTPRNFQFEGDSIKGKLQKKFEGTQAAWNKYPKPGLKMATPLISAAIAAKTKKPESAQIMRNILKSLTSGKILSLTKLHGNGLRLKVS